MVGSPGHGLGQRKPRCSIDAGHQLDGKGLRYLKTVIVTAAVYQPFVSLYGMFRYWHWARVADYTNPFGLAVGYVFSKQSSFPSHCNLSY